MLNGQLGSLTAAESALLFGRLDQRDVTGRQGTLSFAAFIGSLASFSVAQRFAEAMASDAGKAELRNLFDTLDKDGNKKISRVRTHAQRDRARARALALNACSAPLRRAHACAPDACRTPPHVHRARIGTSARWRRARTRRRSGGSQCVKTAS
jgi:hypothetical protein